MAVNFSSSDEETDEICNISHLSESVNDILDNFESFDSKNIELNAAQPYKFEPIEQKPKVHVGINQPSINSEPATIVPRTAELSWYV